MLIISARTFVRSWKFKSIALSIMMLSPAQRASADNGFDVAAQLLCAGGLMYGGYKVYEHYSLKNAQTRLSSYKITAHEIMNHERTDMILDDQKIVALYLNDLSLYEQLCNQVAQDVSMLTRIQHTVEEDIAAWDSHKKAELFVCEARGFAQRNYQRIQHIKQRSAWLEQRKALLQSIILLNNEFKADCYQLVLRASRGNLTESVARAAYPESAWPLRTAWKAIEARKQLYLKEFSVLEAYAHSSPFTADYAYQVRNTLGAYTNAQEIIAGSASYTQELRSEKEFLQKEEEARIAREQAHAAQLAAQAQLRQVRMKQEQIHNQKEQELARLRHELSQIKRRIAHGDTDYYLRQQRNQLQDRIHALKLELYGPQSGWGVITDILFDQD